jgi:uncharacterized protein (DUF302 family)
MIPYGFTKTLNMGFEEAIDRVTQALKQEGFGIISQINVKEKFKEKLGIDFEDYLILGACNPSKAHEAISREENIGLLLPCNVLLYRKGNKTILSIVKPTVSLEKVHNEHLKQIAEDAEKSLKNVFDSLK